MHYQVVHGQVLVVDFVIFSLLFFCFVVSMFDVLHNVEAIFHLT